MKLNLAVLTLTDQPYQFDSHMLVVIKIFTFREKSVIGSQI